MLRNSQTAWINKGWFWLYALTCCVYSCWEGRWDWASGTDARRWRRVSSVGEPMFNRERYRNILTFVTTDFLVRKLVHLCKRNALFRTFELLERSWISQLRIYLHIQFTRNTLISIKHEHIVTCQKNNLMTKVHWCKSTVASFSTKLIKKATGSTTVTEHIVNKPAIMKIEIRKPKWII